MPACSTPSRRRSTWAPIVAVLTTLIVAPSANAAFGPAIPVGAGDSPSVVVDAGSNTGWVVYVKDDGRVALRARAADGALAAGETVLTDPAANNAERPTAALDADGNLNVVWVRDDGVTRTVESAVVPVGGGAPDYRQVSAAADVDHSPQLSLLNAGRAVVVYLEGGAVKLAERDNLTDTFDVATLSTGVGNTSPDVAAGYGDDTITVAWLQSGKVQARTRPEGAGAFESAFEITSGQGRLRPQVAVKGDGTSVIAYEQTSGGVDRVFRAERPAGNGTGWTSFSPISSPGKNGLNARIGVDTAGADTIVWEEGGADPSSDVIMMLTQGGPLAAPVGVAFTGHPGADNPSLGITLSGTAVVTWERAGRIEAATRSAVGALPSTPVAISDAGEAASAPSAAIGLNGTATVAWNVPAAVEAASGNGDVSEPPPHDGGGNGGGGNDGGSGGTDPAPQPHNPPPPSGGPGRDPAILPDPQLIAIKAPEVLKTRPMPDFRPSSRICKKRRFCTLDTVRKHFDKLGIRNIKLVERNGDIDDVPKALRSRIDHGDVVGTSLKPGTPIAEPNILDYPEAPLPSIRVLTWKDPKLNLSCTSKDLKAALERAPAAWPGESTGRGSSKVYGSEDLLKKLKCKYRVKYAKKSGVTTPTISDVDPGKTVEIKVSVPKTEELSIFVDEGAYHPKLIDKGYPGLWSEFRRMPITGDQLGGFTVRVMQTKTVPTTPAPGVQVLLTSGKGVPVAAATTDASGTAALTGYFTDSATYDIVATRADDSGLSVDGSAEIKVRDMPSPYTTPSGRVFRKVGKKWVQQKPAATSGAKVRRAQAPGAVCTEPDEEVLAFVEPALEQTLVDDLRDVQAATDAAAREEATGRFILRYLAWREWGLLERKTLQDALRKYKVSVVNLGSSELKPVTNPCATPTPEQARRVARGYALGSGPIPAIESGGRMLLPDGTTIKNSWSLGDFSTTTFVTAQPKPLPGELRLSPEDAATIIAAVISTGGGNASPDLRNAAAGVISTGGGNVISTGGGNVISTGGGNLTIEQLRGLMRVISTGGGNVISTGGGNMSASEIAAVRAVISTGGGNVISTGGGNLTLPQLRAIMACISVGGGNLISDKGLGLTTPEINAVKAVISTGGGNLISDKGLGLTQLDAMQGVISTGGGNLNADRLRVVQAVISTGGGNVISTGGGNVQGVLLGFLRTPGVISTGGGNLKVQLEKLASIISDNGGGLIGPNGNLIGQAGGNFVPGG